MKITEKSTFRDRRTFIKKNKSAENYQIATVSIIISPKISPPEMKVLDNQQPRFLSTEGYKTHKKFKKHHYNSAI